MQLAERSFLFIRFCMKLGFLMPLLFTCMAALYVLHGSGEPRPPIPERWSFIQAGMTREAVIKTLGSEPHDMRELKGFDQYVHRSNEHDWWRLTLYYQSSESSVVSTVYVSFTDDRSGIRNLNQKNPDRAFFDRHTQRSRP